MSDSLSPAEPQQAAPRKARMTAQSAKRRFRDRAAAAELLFIEGDREEAARLLSDAAEMWLETQAGSAPEQESRVRSLAMRSKHGSETDRDRAVIELIDTALARGKFGARWIAWAIVFALGFLVFQTLQGRATDEATIYDQPVEALIDGNATTDWVAAEEESIDITIALRPARSVGELQIVRSLREEADGAIQVELLGARSAEATLPAGDAVFVALPVGGSARSQIRLRLTPESGVVSIGEIRIEAP